MATKPDDRIQLTAAMGVTKSSTPQQVSTNWKAWKGQYPNEESKLSPAVVISLDTISTVVDTYDSIITIISTVEQAVQMATKTYRIMLSLLPGVGQVDQAKMIAEQAMIEAKAAIQTAVQQIYQLPQTIFDSLTNTRVDKGAVLK